MRYMLLIVLAVAALNGCKEAAQCPAADAGQVQQDAVQPPDVATAVDAADAVTASDSATPVDAYGDATED